MSEELKPETRMEEQLLKRLEALEQQVAQMRDLLEKQKHGTFWTSI